MQGQNKNTKLKYLIGNWKANKTLKETGIWINEVKKSYVTAHRKLKIVLCPAYTHLSLFRQELPKICLGCQDISPYGDGAYTGAVTARMLAGVVDFVILGHSERRRYFAETNQGVALKVIQALDNDITPIIAVERNNWTSQLNALEGNQLSRSIIMYEPPEAISQQIGPIGKGEAAPLEEILEIVAEMKKNYPAKAFIYGGSVKSDNIADFLKEELIDGVLPGSASLNAQEWLKMIKAANQAIQTG